jgi:hypothetical protein
MLVSSQPGLHYIYHNLIFKLENIDIKCVARFESTELAHIFPHSVNTGGKEC